MDTELTAYLEKVREDVEGIYVGYPEIVDKHVPKLMQIIDTLLSVAGSHVRQPRDSTVIRCDCSECTAGRRIAELIKDAKGGA